MTVAARPQRGLWPFVQSLAKWRAPIDRGERGDSISALQSLVGGVLLRSTFWSEQGYDEGTL